MAIYEVTVTRKMKVFVEAGDHEEAEDKVMNLDLNDMEYHGLTEWEEEYYAFHSDLHDWVESLNTGYYFTQLIVNGEEHYLPGSIEDMEEFMSNDDCMDILWNMDDEESVHVELTVFVVGSICNPDYTYIEDEPDWEIVAEYMQELVEYGSVSSGTDFEVRNPYYSDEEPDE